MMSKIAVKIVSLTMSTMPLHKMMKGQTNTKIFQTNLKTNNYKVLKTKK